MGRKILVICPDIVGRGKSDWLKNPIHYTIATYVYDILKLITYLNHRSKITDLDWIGTSVGGLIGVYTFGETGVALPVKPRKLILNESSPVVEWDALQKIIGRVAKSKQFFDINDVVNYIKETYEEFGPHTDEQWLKIANNMMKMNSDGSFSSMHDPKIVIPFRLKPRDIVEKTAGQRWKVYDSITSDTLLLRGAESTLIKRITAEEMSLRGPKPKLIEFSGVGHTPSLIPENQIKIVEDFILSSTT